MTEHAHHPPANAPVQSHEPVTIHPDCMIGNDTSPRAHAHTVGVNEQNPAQVGTYGPHYPYPDNYVQSHEPVHPQWLPESSAPYIAKAVQRQVSQAGDNHAITIPERIHCILDRMEDANRRMLAIEKQIALYEATLGARHQSGSCVASKPM